ncbi:hypothetical protein ACFOON_09535 [Novosphingobium piscinae]|uniref:Uncharacterized protein n=1 Tax=Novosphingobium piscinae TaxID=1507448 RepID=A0A7X1G0L3_9SPHN|nr:hypothetical protein [Novosphingobium piscinae]MBC2670433.1 hypothetical protein [Novosphingobium piscinae]
MSRGAARTGQPVWTLATILLGWGLVRIGAQLVGAPGVPVEAPPLARGRLPLRDIAAEGVAVAFAAGQPRRLVIPGGDAKADAAEPAPTGPPRIVRVELAGPQAGLRAAGGPDGPAATAVEPHGAPPSAAPPAGLPHLDPPAGRTRSGLRIAGDGWVLLRGASAAGAVAGPRYGASQAGAILRLRPGGAVAARGFAYLRASAALELPAQEAAMGLGWRPLPTLALDLTAELRVDAGVGGQRVRPAVGLVGQVPTRRLGRGLQASAYAQAGWVGGREATPYADVHGLIDADLGAATGLPLRAGAGVWAAGQRGATRLDLGPTLTLPLRLGPGLQGRLQADWRQRVAGQAAPGSGPALVLAASF